MDSQTETQTDKHQETHAFQAETKRLLELMIHSLYSNRDIFLRELISNASDALDKRRFAALTDQSIAAEEDLHIRLDIDGDARLVTVHDNGIGMSKDELVAHLGTIAKSGTREFLAALEKAQDQSRPELIGQFGVGFYSSFLVADRVEVVSRKAGETAAHRWISNGVGGNYTVEDAERESPGTSVILHLKPQEKPADSDGDSDGDDGGAMFAGNADENKDYTSRWTVESIVRKYSDFVSYPIKMKVEKAPPMPSPGADDDGNKDSDKDADKLVGQDDKFEDKTLNSMKAIWTRPASEVSDEEYNEFYKHISHDWTDPLTRLTTAIEGTIEARALLYLPSRAPFDIYRPDAQRRGVQLYVKRVFIMDECKELLPNYLRFVKGVVDSEDLPLNVSREILQQNRQIRAIRKHLVRKILDQLRKMMADDRDKYLTFWGQFGAVLKEGLLLSQERNQRIYELMLCESTDQAGSDGTLTSLDDYIGRMKEGQDAIYYLTCPSAEQGRKSPHLEAFRAKGVEVLFLTDQVDEIWVQERPEYEDKKFQSVLQGDIELGSEEERKQAEEAKQQKQSELGDLLLAIRAALQEEVKEVRLSSRLTSSPACLVTADGDVTPQMERLLRATGQDVPKVKRVLELNPDHDIINSLADKFKKSSADPQIKPFSRLLYYQAILSEGGELEQPAEFAQLITDVMVQAAGPSSADK